MQIRDLEAEKLAGEFHLKTVQAQVKELEAQLQLTADRVASERAAATEADTANGEATKMEPAVNASAQLLRRAEWITDVRLEQSAPLEWLRRKHTRLRRSRPIRKISQHRNCWLN